MQKVVEAGLSENREPLGPDFGVVSSFLTESRRFLFSLLREGENARQLRFRPETNTEQNAAGWETTN